MKTLMKSIGTLSLVLLCLSLLTISAAALEQSSQTTNCTSPYYGYQYGQYNYNCNNNGFVGYDWSKFPGSTEYCTKWIPGHWVPVRMMVPGRWEYRRVWIPGYPTTRRQWVPGFWQTTGTHLRPDVYVWGSPNGGWYGRPYQNYQPSQGGYFNPYGLWIPTQKR